MPHQCTTCDRVFDDGSKEMLSGCPDCGGNTFQYLPPGTSPDAAPPANPPERPGPDSSVAETVGKAATTLRDAVSSATSSRENVVFSGTANSREAGASSTDDAISSGEATAADQGTSTDQATLTDESFSSSERDEPRSSSKSEDNESDAATGESTPDHAGEGGRDHADEDGYDAEFVDGDSPEDFAQSSARTDVVTSDELPDGLVGFSGGSPAPTKTTPRAPSNSTPQEPANTTSRDGRPRSQHDPSSSGATGDASGLEPTEAAGSTNGTDSAAAAGSTDGRVVDSPSSETPDLADLREELNDQFEGIKILEPGQYELNLMELYEREETIIALKENGRYMIDVPESWHGD